MDCTTSVPLPFLLSPSAFVHLFGCLFPPLSLAPLILVMPMKYRPWYFLFLPRNHIILKALSTLCGKFPNLRTSNLCDIQHWRAHPLNSLIPTCNMECLIDHGTEPQKDGNWMTAPEFLTEGTNHESPNSSGVPDSLSVTTTSFSLLRYVQNKEHSLPLK